MTATVGDLVRVLDQQVRTLGAATEHDTASAHVGGWMLLARTTRHAIGLLPLGGRTAQVKAGLRTVLDPLVHGPRDPLPQHRPAPRLRQASRTMGAIADVLADHLRGGGRAEQIGTEAVKLQASLLSAVHVAARWSRSIAESQQFPPTAVAFLGQLSDLIVVTEPFALVPPSRRASLLEDLRLPNPAAPGLEGAAIRWITEARQILQERHRVSGWAMQAIAGNLALLSQTAGRTALTIADAGAMTAGHADTITSWFTEAARHWRTAATWPAHVRLGGHTPTLRVLGAQFRDACTTATPGLADLRPTLDAALRLSLLHAAVMDGLARRHELWVNTVRTDYRGARIESWTREPPSAKEGQLLAQAASDGHHALDRATRELVLATSIDNSWTDGWPMEPNPDRGIARHPAEARGLPRRPGLEIGR